LWSTKIRSTLILLSIAFLFSCAFISSEGQAQDKYEQSSWQAKLYGKDVDYKNFACKNEDAQAVATFFKEHSLKRALPICHNDCPIIRCRPVIQLASIARAARVTGTVSVHVLVDEQGKALYARVLNGHPLLWAAARKGACETQFSPYPDHKRQGVMHFKVEDSAFLGVPYTANQVR